MAGPVSFGYHILGFGGGKKPVASGPTTSKVRVLQYDEDGGGACDCVATSTYVIAENDSTVDVGGMGGGSDLTLAVDDWISFMDINNMMNLCGKVVAINSTATADAITVGEYGDCNTCQIDEAICMDGICLLPHMLVKLKNGELTKVIDLNIGDLIESPDGYTEVVELVKDHPRSGYHIIEDELYISSDHPIEFLGGMIRVDEYPGNNQYIEEESNTVYVGTADPVFKVFCDKHVYIVSGQYRRN